MACVFPRVMLSLKRLKILKEIRDNLKGTYQPIPKELEKIFGADCSSVSFSAMLDDLITEVEALYAITEDHEKELSRSHFRVQQKTRHY